MNSIDLGTSPTGSHREIRVESEYASLRGTLTGTDPNTGLLKTGAGILGFENFGDDYYGPTIIRDGAVVANSPAGMPSPNTNIQLDGDFSGTGGVWIPVLGYYGSYLGSGPGQVQWTGSGGFAALFDITVQLNGTPDPIAWGAQYFVGDGHELRFGHFFTSGTVIWDKGLDLGFTPLSGKNRTIRLIRGTDPAQASVLFNKELISQNGVNYDTGVGAPNRLTFVGDGKAEITQANPNFRAEQIHIYGATLDLREAGSFTGSTTNFDIRHGGTLSLSNTATSYITNRLNGGNATIALNAGTFRFGAQIPNFPVKESIAHLQLRGFSANKIILDVPGYPNGSPDALNYLNINTIWRNEPSNRSTLDIEGFDLVFISANYGGFAEDFAEDAENPLGAGVIVKTINAPSFGTITKEQIYLYPDAPTLSHIYPWATANKGETWLTGYIVNDGSIYLSNLKTYHTGNPSTWATEYSESIGGKNYNVSFNFYAAVRTLTSNRFVNSLRITGGTLDLGNYQLTLNSGGLLTVRNQLNADAGNWGITNGRIGTAANRPLYMHIYSDSLQLNGNASLVGWMDVVKTGPGELRSFGNHQIGSLYINQGMVDLRNGTLTLGGGDTRVYVGDGASTDILKLQGNRRDQIQKQGGGLPSITLQGTPYNPRGPEYGGDQAILQMGGNTKLSLANLRIQDRGTIDWVGGEVSKANILYLDTLTFSGPDAILFMRNWYEYEDRLLVKSNGIDLSYLQNIRFEGYENYPVIIRKYDAHYWEITPFGTMTPFPEPTTTGAILAAVGIGLVAWRRRKARSKSRFVFGQASEPNRDLNGSGH